MLIHVYAAELSQPHLRYLHRNYLNSSAVITEGDDLKNI